MGIRLLCAATNGLKFLADALKRWAATGDVEIASTDPGKPGQNGSIKSFNSRFCDECLDEEWFANRQEARVIIEAWRQEYDLKRPHRGIGCKTSNETKKALAKEILSGRRTGGLTIKFSAPLKKQVKHATKGRTMFKTQQSPLRTPSPTQPKRDLPSNKSPESSTKALGDKVSYSMIDFADSLDELPAEKTPLKRNQPKAEHKKHPLFFEVRFENNVAQKKSGY